MLVLLAHALLPVAGAMKQVSDGFAPLLAQLAAHAQTYFGDGGAVIEPVSRLDRQYSALLRLRVQADGRTSYAFLKVFRPVTGQAEELAQLRRFVEREYRAASRLYDALHGRAGIQALRPLAVFPDQLALVTEEVQGETFDLVVTKALKGTLPMCDVEAVAQRIGEWVRTYQDVTPVEGVVSLDERRRYLDDRLRKMEGNILTSADRASALGLFDRLAARIVPGDLPQVAIHADLCPTNIVVVPDGGVTVLDFAMAKTGARYHDVAHLYLHLERLRRGGRRLDVAALQRALLRGVGAGVTDRHPPFALMLLQHAVCDIAQQAQRQVGPLSALYRLLVRRRWAKALAMPALVEA